MNDVDKMPSKCRDCSYWEIAKYPWCCGDCKEKKHLNLKPCPFCGKDTAEITNAHDLEECGNWEEDVCPCVAMASADYCGAYIVVCAMTKGGCGASACYCSSPEQAAAAWNRRMNNA